jgi:hypothetical protein
MPSESDWLEFGPEDENGFRSFSLYTDRQEQIRVSVHFGAIREYLTRTAGDLNLYSDAEQESLKTAASMLAAKTPVELAAGVLNESGPAGVTDLALKNLLEGVTNITMRSYEKWFPGLALLALQAASDTCVKKALNILMKGLNAPPVTTEKSINVILDDFRKGVKIFLREAGRHVESTRLIQDVQEALRRVEKRRLKRNEPYRKPRQEEVAEILEVSSRSLRSRQAKYGIKTWDEMLRVCGWSDGKREETNSV